MITRQAWIELISKIVHWGLSTSFLCVTFVVFTGLQVERWELLLCERQPWITADWWRRVSHSLYSSSSHKVIKKQGCSCEIPATILPVIWEHKAWTTLKRSDTDLCMCCNPQGRFWPVAGCWSVPWFEFLLSHLSQRVSLHTRGLCCTRPRSLDRTELRKRSNCPARGNRISRLQWVHVV